MVEEPPKSTPPAFRRWLRAILGMGFLFIVIHWGILFFRIYSLKFHNPGTTAFIQHYLDHCGKIQNGCPFAQTWKPLRQISKNLEEAVLIGEDDAFFEHEGIDPEAIRESIEINLKKNRIVRGGSTITQQLVKNLYLSSSKDPLRKLNEIGLALLMEKLLAKQRILEIYLNVIEWGEGIYGAEAASQFYFKKPAGLLTSEEAAYLAAILPNPSLLTDPRHARRAGRRKAIILKRMGRRITSPPPPPSSDRPTSAPSPF